MNRARLTLRITDLSREQTSERSFFSSPVTIGRSTRNQLCLESPDVAAFHGALLFDHSSLYYVDLAPTNRTKVNYVSISADLPLKLAPTTVLSIGPFAMIVSLDSVPAGEAHRADAETAPDDHSLDDDAEALSIDVLGERPALRDLLIEWGPFPLLAAALRAVDTVACVLASNRPGLPAGVSFLDTLRDPDEILVYLLDPEVGGEGVADLLVLLSRLMRGPSAKGAGRGDA